jgi:serine phosphatase RsbU (regulator of sigma subunit)
MAGVEYPVIAASTSIGRTPDQDIFLEHDSVSRRHARIDRAGDQYHLLDLGSTNGTFVAGKRVRSALLEEGADVVIGELKFKYSAEDVAQDDAAGILRGVGRVLELLTEQARAPATPEAATSPSRDFADRMRSQQATWEEAYRQLTVLYRIAYLLQGGAEAEVKLDKVVQLAIGTLRAERGFLFRYVPADDDLKAEVAYSKSSEGGTHLDWVRAVARRTIDTDEPMASGPNLSVGAAMTRPPSGRVFIAAPVRTPRSIHGCLYLDARSEHSHWTGNEVEFVRTLAAQIGSTYDQEEYARHLISKRELERELSIARNIQQSLLPDQLDTGEGILAHGRSTPSKEVGGDYYDTFRSVDGDTVWLLADVSGKGVPAALVQAQVRSHLRAAARRGLDPELILTDLNEALLADYGGRMYVTCVIGTVDAERKVLRYVNAGHEFPQVLRGESGEVERLEDGDHPCGLFGGAAFTAFEVPFAPGDTILLATDGIVDSQDTNEERFGHERFADLVRDCHGLAPYDLVERVFQRVGEFSEGAPQRDDITLLAVQLEA